MDLATRYCSLWSPYGFIWLSKLQFGSYQNWSLGISSVMSVDFIALTVSWPAFQVVIFTAQVIATWEVSLKKRSSDRLKSWLRSWASTQENKTCGCEILFLTWINKMIPNMLSELQHAHTPHPRAVHSSNMHIMDTAHSLFRASEISCFLANATHAACRKEHWRDTKTRIERYFGRIRNLVSNELYQQTTRATQAMQGMQGMRRS